MSHFFTESQTLNLTSVILQTVLNFNFCSFLIFVVQVSSISVSKVFFSTVVSKVQN